MSMFGMTSFLDGRAKFHVFSDSIVNAHIYRDDILDVYVCAYTSAIGAAQR